MPPDDVIAQPREPNPHQVASPGGIVVEMTDAQLRRWIEDGQPANAALWLLRQADEGP